MARVKKDLEERKQEILEAAVRLFQEKGYENTFVSDIVHAANIAQGTFYLYFKSKDDIYLAVVEASREKHFEQLLAMTKRNDLNAGEKLDEITKFQVDQIKVRENLYSHLQNDNAGIFYPYIINTIKKLVPLYTAIIEQGNKESIFHVKYPKETAEYMTLSRFLFNPGVFPLEKEELAVKVAASRDIWERMLGVAKLD